MRENRTPCDANRGRRHCRARAIVWSLIVAVPVLARPPAATAGTQTETKVTLTASPVDFDMVTLGDQKTLEVTEQNSGLGRVAILSVQIEQSGSTDFSVVDEGCGDRTLVPTTTTTTLKPTAGIGVPSTRGPSAAGPSSCTCC